MSEAITAVLLLASGAVVLVGALGLVRLKDFFTRMHAPSVAYTLASWSVALATVVHFSTRAGELSLHAWLVIVLLSITAPVTTLLLSRAALFRARTGEGTDEVPPPLAEKP